MQCKCGGDADTDIKAFPAEKSEECLKYAFPKQPEQYPCVVHRSLCAACGRASVNITYNLNGFFPGDKILPGWETQPPPKVKKTRRLF